MSGDVLHLDGEAPLPARLVGYYRHPYRHYAPLYGYADEKTIKRFVKMGKNAQPKPDMPPLDDPAEMPAWWRRHHPKVDVPAGIRRAASAARDEGLRVPAEDSQQNDEATPPLAAESAQVAAPMAPPPGENKAGAMDFPAQVAALAQITEEHLRQLRNVSAEVEPPGMTDDIDRATWARGKSERIEAAQRTYKSSMEILRKAENDLVEWRKSHDELAPKAETAAEISRIVGAIHTSVKRMLRKVRPLLAGKSEAEQEAIFAEEVRECFRILTKSKFANVAIPEAPAQPVAFSLT